MVLVLRYEKGVLGSGIDLTIQSVTDGLHSCLRELGTRSSISPCFISQRLGVSLVEGGGWEGRTHMTWEH